MSTKYDFVKDLNPTKEEWKIKVRVVRLWKVPNFHRKDFDDNVEMVLLDKQGGRVHATCKSSLQVRKSFREGEVYFIKKFGVGLNTDNFKSTRHDYRLSFNLRTDVKHTVDGSIYNNRFDFVEFDYIHTESPDSPYLVGVIGLPSGIGEVREHVVSSRKAKIIVLELDNLRGQKIECTVWDQYVDEVQSFLANNQSPQIVIIVQLARIKGFRGKNGITNTKYQTKIILDPNVPEVLDFKKRLSNDLIESSQRLTQLSSQSSYSFETDFLKEIERKCISDIKNCREVMTCITYGTIKSIENKYNWWYKSCKKCPYSVCEDFEKWYCKNCEKHWAEYYPKFCVEVRVVDNTDSASFILFDRDCFSLLGMTASELRDQHFKRGSDLEHYSEELDVLKERSLLFKVNVKKINLNSYNEPKYQIAKVCTCDSVIAAFLAATVEQNDEVAFDGACKNEIVSTLPEANAVRDFVCRRI